jgi:hypothetical protein
MLLNTVVMVTITAMKHFFFFNIAIIYNFEGENFQVLYSKSKATL